MKKYLSFFMAAIFFATFTISCDKDDDNDDDDNTPEVSLLAEVTATWGWADDAQETWKYTYDEQKRLTKVENYYEGEFDKAFDYDYSTPGKLFITRTDQEPLEHHLDSEGRITRAYWSATDYAGYTYNADGLMTKIIEHYDGADHDKWDIEVVDGNIMKHTRYNSSGDVDRIKTFAYTIGDNVNFIDEAIVESAWKTVSGLFGKTSEKLVDYLDYWNGPGDEANAKRTTITYEFDDKNRVSKMTRTGDGWVEVFDYTYID